MRVGKGHNQRRGGEQREEDQKAVATEQVKLLHNYPRNGKEETVQIHPCFSKFFCIFKTPAVEM